MKAFAALYTAIDETNRTNEKVAAMEQYFANATAEDAAWAVTYLIGRRPKRLIQTGKLWAWGAELSGVPEWLFAESYDAVGDTAETIALVLPDPTHLADDLSLDWWVTNRLLPLASLTDEEQHELLVDTWMSLLPQERFVFNKLITGSFRVGVSQELVQRALSRVSGVPAPTIAHRLMGDWKPSAQFYEDLMGEDGGETLTSKPYPFSLAHPLENDPTEIGTPEDWQIEWKWDGIRAQVIRRKGESFIWSRGEELISDRFPEILAVANNLPDGTVLDGEILAWRSGGPLKFMELQKRIGRKTITARILKEVPVVLVAFDILENEGSDVREKPISERRKLLEKVVNAVNDRPDPQLKMAIVEEGSLPEPTLQLSPLVHASNWDQVAEERQNAREHNVEGLMLKRKDSPYLVGRKRGFWWKWKIEPLTVDAVMIYAQRGSGKRASLYTDYTFGLWDGESLVPVAKAYSGLTDAEICQVDNWVRRNTLEKFGPVRTVKPELVFELAFEGIQLSTRHKSGIAVRFPRILRWRHDKLPKDADSLTSVKELLLALA